MRGWRRKRKAQALGSGKCTCGTCSYGLWNLQNSWVDGAFTRFSHNVRSAGRRFASTVASVCLLLAHSNTLNQCLLFGVPVTPLKTQVFFHNQAAGPTVGPATDGKARGPDPKRAWASPA